MNPTEKLAAKVAAVNRANELANHYHLILANHAKNFLGKKIFKADGSLTKAFKDATPPLPKWSNTQNRENIYFSPSEYSLYYHVQATCVTDVSLFIGKVDRGVLVEVNEPINNRRTDWTADEVSYHRGVAEKFAKLARDAESMIAQFGSTDW